MIKGKSLQELAAELDRQSNARQDMVVDTAEIKYTPDSLYIEGQGQFEMTEHAHKQISQRIDIPHRYYKRMQKEALSY